MSRAFPAFRALAAIASTALVLSACGSDDEQAAPEAPASAATASAPEGDGVLRIGTLLPETGNLTVLGPPEIAGVNLAIDEINEAGGVLGKDVELSESDSGDTETNIASQSVDRLLDAGADAIVGAASSSVTLTVIDKITGSGVLQISPANTSTKLSDYDDDDLYWRTAPSDVLQGRVLGDLALRDGAETLGVLALQDAYGTSLADEASAAFEAGGGAVVERVIYNPAAPEFAAEVRKIADADPDAIALIGFDESSKILEEMVSQGLLPLQDSGKSLYFTDGNLSNTYDLADGTLEGVKGTLPGSEAQEAFRERLTDVDSDLDDFSYAAEAYDATIMVALAAEAADEDTGPAIAEQLQDVSRGGEKCSTFEDCLELLSDGEDIDYDGQSGPVEFDDNGNPSVASMGIYEYGVDNTYEPVEFVTGPVAGGELEASDSQGSSEDSADSDSSDSSEEDADTSDGSEDADSSDSSADSEDSDSADSDSAGDSDSQG